MHLIISIAVVMVVAHSQIIDTCVDYCNFLTTDPLRVFWRPDCVCTLEYQGNNYRNNKLMKLKRNPSVEDSAIYYKPSSEYPYNVPSFVDYPFYIVNPTYHEEKLKNLDTGKVRKFNINIAGRAREEGLDHSLMKRKQDDISVRSIDINSKHLPLSLDIDIYKNNDKYKNIKANIINKVDMTENDLMECIKLHILVYLRKSDKNVQELKHIVLDESKINKYKGLSDSDLMIEIQSKCHQPTTIIKDSLQDIKNSWPKKDLDPKNVEYFGDAKTSESSNTTKINETKILQPTEEPTGKTVTLIITNSNGNDYTIVTNKIDSKNKTQSNGTEDPTLTKKYYAVNNVTETIPEVVKSNTREISLTTVNPNVSLNFEQEISNYDFLPNNTTENLPIYITTGDKNTTHISLNDQKRTDIKEIEIKVPKIETKELKNSTIITNIGGTELIPNNDFVENTTMNNQGISEFKFNEIFVTKYTTERALSSKIDFDDKNRKSALNLFIKKSKIDSLKTNEIVYTTYEKQTKEEESNFQVTSTPYSNNSIIPREDLDTVKKYYNNTSKNNSDATESDDSIKLILDASSESKTLDGNANPNHSTSSPELVSLSQNCDRSTISQDNMNINSKNETNEDQKKRTIYIKSDDKINNRKTSLEVLTTHGLPTGRNKNLIEQIEYQKENIPTTSLPYAYYVEEDVTDTIESLIPLNVLHFNTSTTPDVLENLLVFNNSNRINTLKGYTYNMTDLTHFYRNGTQYNNSGSVSSTNKLENEKSIDEKELENKKIRKLLGFSNFSKSAEKRKVDEPASLGQSASFKYASNISISNKTSSTTNAKPFNQNVLSEYLTKHNTRLSNQDILNKTLNIISTLPSNSAALNDTLNKNSTMSLTKAVNNRTLYINNTTPRNQDTSNKTLNKSNAIPSNQDAYENSLNKSNAKALNQDALNQTLNENTIPSNQKALNKTLNKNNTIPINQAALNEMLNTSISMSSNQDALNITLNINNTIIGNQDALNKTINKSNTIPSNQDVSNKTQIKNSAIPSNQDTLNTTVNINNTKIGNQDALNETINKSDTILSNLEILNKTLNINNTITSNKDVSNKTKTRNSAIPSNQDASKKTTSKEHAKASNQDALKENENKNNSMLSNPNVLHKAQNLNNSIISNQDALDKTQNNSAISSNQDTYKNSRNKSNAKASNQDALNTTLNLNNTKPENQGALKMTLNKSNAVILNQDAINQTQKSIAIPSNQDVSKKTLDKSNGKVSNQNALNQILNKNTLPSYQNVLNKNNTIRIQGVLNETLNTSSSMSSNQDALNTTLNLNNTKIGNQDALNETINKSDTILSNLEILNKTLNINNTIPSNKDVSNKTQTRNSAIPSNQDASNETVNKKISMLSNRNVLNKAQNNNNSILSNQDALNKTQKNNAISLNQDANKNSLNKSNAKASNQDAMNQTLNENTIPPNETVLNETLNISSSISSNHGALNKNSNINHMLIANLDTSQKSRNNNNAMISNQSTLNKTQNKNITVPLNQGVPNKTLNINNTTPSNQSALLKIPTKNNTIAANQDDLINKTPSNNNAKPPNQDDSPLSRDVTNSSQNNATVVKSRIDEHINPQKTNISIIDSRNSSKKNELSTVSKSKDLMGELYFLFDEEQVPVRFVQNADGKLNLGLDGETLCDKVINSNYSVLIKALCDCSVSKNCTSFR